MVIMGERMPPRTLLPPVTGLPWRACVTAADDAALRSYLERILGWRNPDAIDRALRSIHLCAAHQAALVLRGQGDLVPLAVALHRRALGMDAPFIMSDPRRGNTPASVRSPANYEHCLAAFEAARGGTLCIRARRLPSDFPQVLTALRDPDSCVQLAVCYRAGDNREPLLAVPAPIDLPRLRDRTDDLARILDEYARDAAIALWAREPLTTGAARSAVA